MTVAHGNQSWPSRETPSHQSDGGRFLGLARRFGRSSLTDQSQRPNQEAAPRDPNQREPSSGIARASARITAAMQQANENGMASFTDGDFAGMHLLGQVCMGFNVDYVLTNNASEVDHTNGQEYGMSIQGRLRAALLPERHQLKLDEAGRLVDNGTTAYQLARAIKTLDILAFDPRLGREDPHKALKQFVPIEQIVVDPHQLTQLVPPLTTPDFTAETDAHIFNVHTYV